MRVRLTNDGGTPISNIESRSHGGRREREVASPKHILIIDDDEVIRERLAVVLASHNFEATVVADAEAALDAVEDVRFDAFLVDVQLPGIDGFELMGRLRTAAPDAPVIIITSYGDLESAVTALRAGAFDFLTKPILPESLLLALDRAFEMYALAQENLELRRESKSTRRVGGLIGASEDLKKIMSVVRRVADSTSTVLITGESGTGKDVVARSLHEEGSRASGPYLPINCAAIPELRRYRVHG